jgi:hypothetical protein
MGMIKTSVDGDLSSKQIYASARLIKRPSELPKIGLSHLSIAPPRLV